MHYPVLTDMDNGYALSLNLAIWVGAELQELMAASGRDLPRYQGNERLGPADAGELRGRMRTASYAARFIDPDYRKRMAIEDLLQAIRNAPHFAADSALVDLLLKPDRAYPFWALSGIENRGVKRNNSGSLRIGGRGAATGTMEACK